MSITKNLLAMFAGLMMTSASAFAQKSVTYEFTGRNGTPFNILVKKQPLTLKVTRGTAPVGVTVASIEGFEYDETTAEQEKGVVDVSIQNFAALPIIPLYVIGPSTSATIKFNGFKYEVYAVKWWRGSRILGLTSKGLTWVTNYADADAGKWGFDTGHDVANEGYNSGLGPICYQDDFIDPTIHEVKGLTTLNIFNQSKLPGHGLIVDKFEIKYYDPEITISDNELTLVQGSSADDIVAKITAHQGAFENSEIVFEKTDKNGVIDLIPGTVDGSGKHATITPSATKTGSALVIAKIMVNGKEAAKTSYKVNVVPSDPITGFGYVDARFWENNNRDGVAQTWGDKSNTNTISLKDAYLNETRPQSTSTTLVDMTATTVHKGREGVVAVSYTHEVPAYTNVTRKFGFTMQHKFDYSGAASDEHIYTEIREHDDLNSSIAFAALGQNAPSVLYSHWDLGLWDSGKSFQSTSTTTSGTYPHWNLVMPNSTNDEAKTFTKYYTLAGNGRNSNGTLALGFEWVFSYSNPADAFEFDYFSTINYVALENDATCLLDSHDIDVKQPTNKVEVLKGGIAGEIPATTEGKPLKKISEGTVERDGYIFIGWKEAIDNLNGTYTYVSDKIYADGEDFCPFDSENLSGKGPRTLIAQWKAIIPDPTDPSVDPDDIHTYLFLPGEGTLVDPVTYKEVPGIADIFTFGQAAPTAPTIFAPTRPGYNFKGYGNYTTETPGDGDVMVYGADCSILNDGIYISGGKWIYDSDVKLFAVWEKNTTEYNSLKHTLTLNANGGKVKGADTQTLEVLTGGVDNSNVVAYTPTRTNFTFTGWFYEEEVDSWTAFENMYKGTSAHHAAAGLTPAYVTLDGKNYAQSAGGLGSRLAWTDAPHNYKVNPSTVAMVYNANGESSYIDDIVVDEGGAEIPTLVDVNSTYWHNNTYVPNANLTVYAHWVADADLTSVTFYEGNKSASNKNATYKIGTTEAVELSSKPTFETTVEYETVTMQRELKREKWNTVCFPFYVSKKQVDDLFEEVLLYNTLEKESDDLYHMKYVSQKDNGMMAGKPYFVKFKDDAAITATKHEAYISNEEGGVIKEIIFKDVQLANEPGKLVRTYDADNVTVEMNGSFNTVLRIAENKEVYTDTDEYDYLYLQNDLFYVSGGLYNVKQTDGTYKEKTVWGNIMGFRCYFKQTKDQTASMSKSRIVFNLDDMDNFITDIDEVMVDTCEPIEQSGAIYDLSGRRLSTEPTQGLYIMAGKKVIR